MRWTAPTTGIVNFQKWHKGEVQRPSVSGPLTGALPTFGPECRFIGAFQTQGQAVTKVAV